MKTLKIIDSYGHVIDTVPADIMNNPAKLKEYIKKSNPDSLEKSKSQMTFHQANNFAQVASEIFHKHLNKDIQCIDPNYLSPYVVNATFALELFLKTLHQSHKTKSYDRVYREHNLKELYLSLPGKIQRDIEKSVKACLIAEKKPSNSIELSKRFKEIANAFVEWRYMHEKGYLKISCFSELIILLNALYNSCVDLKWYEQQPTTNITYKNRCRAADTLFGC